MSSSQQKVLNYEGLDYFYNQLTNLFADKETVSSNEAILGSVLEWKKNYFNAEGTEFLGTSSLVSSSFKKQETDSISLIGALNEVNDSSLAQFGTNAQLLNTVFESSSALGTTTLSLGNNTKSTASYNSQGILQLYGTEDYSGFLTYAGQTKTSYLSLPEGSNDASAPSELALRKDLSNYTLNEDFGAYQAQMTSELNTKMALPSEYEGEMITEENGVEGYGFKAIASFDPIQKGSGDPYPAGEGKNLINSKMALTPNSKSDMITELTSSGSTITLGGIPTNVYAQLKVVNPIKNIQSLIGKTLTLSAILGGNQPHLLLTFNDASNNPPDDRLATIPLTGIGQLTGSVVVPEGTVKTELILCLNRGNYDGTTKYTATYTDVQLEVGETATEYIPYSNIRPIVGYDNISITRNGKNLIPTEWEQGGISSTTGIDVGGSSVIRSGWVAVVPNNLYTISRTGTAGAFAVRCYDENKNYLGTGGVGTTTVKGGSHANPLDMSRNEATIKVLEGCYYLRFIDYANDLTNKYQMEVGETATAYESYKGDTYIISLGDTYYGGKLDVNKGELVIDKACYIATGADDEYWEKITTSSTDGLDYFFTNIAPAKTINVAATTQQCSHYPHGYVISNNSIQNKFRIYTPTDGPYERFCIRPNITVYPDVTSWKVYLQGQYNAGTPVQVVYELKEPQVIKLPSYSYPSTFSPTML